MSEIQGFFSTESMMRACNSAVLVARRKTNQLAENDREFSCFHFIGTFLFHASARPDIFDANLQFNIENIGGHFLDDLNEFIVSDGDNKDQVFVYCYRMSVEFDVSHSKDVSSDLQNVMYSAREYGRHLEGSYAIQFEYAGHQMAIQVLKRFIHHPALTKLVDLPGSIEHAGKVIKEFTEDLNAREERADNLKKALNSYKDAFNFVGLNKGFRNLRDDKIAAARVNLRFLFFLGFAMASVPVAKLVMDFMQKGVVEGYGFYISALGLELVLIFFFKVCLHNYRSIKAQLLQLDLRMTLCQFIQDYASYAIEIKAGDKEVLAGFEKIVFSGIVTSEESIPSTFDGIEKIAEIVAALKK